MFATLTAELPSVAAENKHIKPLRGTDGSVAAENKHINRSEQKTPSIAPRQHL